MTEQTWWLVGVAAVIAAAAIGFFAGRTFGGARKRVVALEEEVSRQKEEISGYKREVESHFDKTATLVASMAGSYKDLFEHLSSGYEKLSSGSARELFRDRVAALLLGSAGGVAAAGMLSDSETVEPADDVAGDAAADATGDAAADAPEAAAIEPKPASDPDSAQVEEVAVAADTSPEALAEASIAEVNEPAEDAAFPAARGTGVDEPATTKATATWADGEEVSSAEATTEAPEKTFGELYKDSGDDKARKDASGEQS